MLPAVKAVLSYHYPFMWNIRVPLMEVGLLKSTSGGSQASRIEIQTFFLIISITIFPRPLGTYLLVVLDAIKFHPVLTGILQSLQFGPQHLLHAQSQWWWMFLPKSLHKCLLWDANPIVCGLAGICLVKKDWAWRHEFVQGMFQRILLFPALSFFRLSFLGS